MHADALMLMLVGLALPDSLTVTGPCGSCI